MLYLRSCGIWEGRVREVGWQEAAGNSGLSRYVQDAATYRSVSASTQASAGPVEGKDEERREGTARMERALTRSEFEERRPLRTNIARGEKRPAYNVSALFRCVRRDLAIFRASETPARPRQTRKYLHSKPTPAFGSS